MGTGVLVSCPSWAHTRSSRSRSYSKHHSDDDCDNTTSRENSMRFGCSWIPSHQSKHPSLFLCWFFLLWLDLWRCRGTLLGYPRGATKAVSSRRGGFSRFSFPRNAVPSCVATTDLIRGHICWPVFPHCHLSCCDTPTPSPRGPSPNTFRRRTHCADSLLTRPVSHLIFRLTPAAAFSTCVRGVHAVFCGLSNTGIYSRPRIYVVETRCHGCGGEA
jgi:hypothetical protein